MREIETAVAPLSLRLAAALIDLWPVYVAQLLIFHHLGHAKLSRIYTSPFNVWVFAIGAAVYVIHPLVAELIWTRSLGKMCVGIRVVSRVNGGRPPIAAIVLR